MRFRDDREGATALEFALIAPVLFCSLFAIIEVGVMSIMSSALDNSVASVSRRIRTNREDAPASAADFKRLLCEELGGAQSSCATRLAVSVQKFEHFGDATDIAVPADQFNNGGAGDIIVVRVNYKWSVITPFLAMAFPHSGGNDVILASRAAFKNEPFS